MPFWQKARSLPSLRLDPRFSPKLRASFLIPVHRCDDVLERTVLAVRDYLTSRFPHDFEIIVIPNGTEGASGHDCKVAHALAQRFPEVKVTPNVSQPGKGLALRTGFAQSLGQWIFLMDADFPYDLAFFGEAARLLAGGVDFVTGNRRLPQSRFDIPVTVLHLVYRRHLTGILFNRLVRLLFPIAVTDTQAGIKAMSRRMATAAFSRQICPGFFFDIEFFLCCAGSGFRSAEVPVTLFLDSEKSTVQLVRESLLAAVWLAKIRRKFARNGYASDAPATATTALNGSKLAADQR